jgi:TRAP-type C4-dicarboxylate transport system substrate-binding protein
MRGSAVRYALFFLVLLLLVPPLFAQRKITVKFASLVPENTPWGAAINRMATEWDQATNGEVEVVVYHNGVAGDEGEVLRKLKLNQLQAAIFTSIGLNSVMPEVMTISYPFLIRNNDELVAVLDKIRPELDAKIQQNGFVTLAWARAGWIRIFSRTPILTPTDLRKTKLATNPDELEMMQAFKTMGYQLVPLNLNEVLVALNGGMIDALYQSPISVAGFQLFGIAKNMTDVNLAPFMGGIVMNSTAWRRIPDKYKPQLQAICKRIETDVENSISKLEADAISTMARHGLVIHRPSPAQVQEWYTDMSRYESSMVGPIFNREFYQKIKIILEDYRRGR